jgi:hypothetical protein
LNLKDLEKRFVEEFKIEELKLMSREMDIG